jgi:hypothetical protein
MPTVTRHSKINTSSDVRATKKVSRAQETKKKVIVTQKGSIPSSSVNKVSTHKTVERKKTPQSALVVRSMKRGSKKIIKKVLLSPVFYRVARYSTLFVIVGILVYGAYHTASTTFANEVVVSQSEIIARVAKLQELPSVSPTDIVRVQDPENLKQQNSFYTNVKEGDYIIMYPQMAIIYDLRNDVIIEVKEVDIQENPETKTTF